jgi:hypothetical protein
LSHLQRWPRQQMFQQAKISFINMITRDTNCRSTQRDKET